MCPLEIQMMLHYYAVAEPYAKDNPEHAQSLAVEKFHKVLVCRDMLIKDDNPYSGYAVTDKGRAYIKAITSVPLPTQKWGY